ncbi:acyl-CoA dehydrogenase family protein [Paenarthrobacter sp. YIM B13468]|uniref:acyl-CoA dehydrogenase family protein n=1 Tax=Paenarthrobacter sp. YIM B13468 TaxID=3366295 RepID=UPI00366CDA29
MTPPYADADFLSIGSLLSPEELAEYESVRSFFQSEIRPAATAYWNRAEFPYELLPKLANQNITRFGPNTGHLLNGLVHMEIARADTSISTLFGVHHELFTRSIQDLGSEEQIARFVPDLLALRKIGGFALTEPDHGSDISRALETSARWEGDGWILNGEKRWIGNGTNGDYLLVWARDVADGQIKGFVVERGTPGFTATAIENKIALRAVQNAHIRFQNVRVPESNRLPGATGFKAANQLLLNSRVWVGWQSVGQQLAAFDVARKYAMTRNQFGRPIASFQLVQEPLSRILGNASMSLALMIQLARMQTTGGLHMEQAAMAKASCTARMRESVALARNILGGNGITTEYEIAKIFADAEAIYAYEGSYEVNSLIVGRAVTGISAF